jgi:hypothetical protein
MLGILAYYFYFAPQSSTAAIVGSGGVQVGGSATIATHVTAAAPGSGAGHQRRIIYPRQQRAYAVHGSGGVVVGGAAVIDHQDADDVRAIAGAGSLGAFSGAAMITTGRTARMIFHEREEEDLLAISA